MATGLSTGRQKHEGHVGGIRIPLSRVLYLGPLFSDGMRWVVVKIMVPFWVPIIIRHLLFRVPNKGP